MERFEPAFRLEGATVWRGGATGRRVLLDAVDWEARQGEHWALLGPNGAGKTTLLTLAAAVKHPSGGSVEVLGRRLGRTDVFRLREEIGFVDARLGRRFLPTLSVEEVVSTGATNTIALLGERVTPAHRERVDELLETTGIAQLRASRLGDCSHGERTRALIARALVSRPRLLLLDEPGAGLDFEGRETVLAALAALAVAEPTLTTVTTTHHVEELAPTTTHALLLRAGRVVAAGRTGEVLTATALTECFGLPIHIAQTNGRWSAVAARAPQT
jgi:iron complex transport system ATP-binding protein